MQIQQLHVSTPRSADKVTQKAAYFDKQIYAFNFTKLTILWNGNLLQHSNCVNMKKTKIRQKTIFFFNPVLLLFYYAELRT